MVKNSFYHHRASFRFTPCYIRTKTICWFTSCSSFCGYLKWDGYKRRIVGALFLHTNWRNILSMVFRSPPKRMFTVSSAFFQNRSKVLRGCNTQSRYPFALYFSSQLLAVDCQLCSHGTILASFPGNIHGSAKLENRF